MIQVIQEIACFKGNGVNAKKTQFEIVHFEKMAYFKCILGL